MDRDIAEALRAMLKSIFWTSNPNTSPVNAAKQAGFQLRRVYSWDTAGGNSNDNRNTV